MTDISVLSQEVRSRVSVIHYKGIEVRIEPTQSFRQKSKTCGYLFTPQESQVLKILLSEPGVVWSKDRLLCALYPEEPRPEIKILDVVICKIRRKLTERDSALGDLITTVWGRGYMVGENKQGVRIVLPEQSRRFRPIPGRALTVNDLPPTNSTARWVISKKLLAVQLVAKGKITLEQLLSMYPSLSEREFRSWQNAIARGGDAALRITRSAELL